LTASQKVVTPAKAGVQISHNLLKGLGSGLHVIPDFDPGRNDGEEHLSTFYDTIKFHTRLHGLGLVERSFFSTRRTFQ